VLHHKRSAWLGGWVGVRKSMGVLGKSGACQGPVWQGLYWAPRDDTLGRPLASGLFFRGSLGYPVCARRVRRGVTVHSTRGSRRACPSHNHSS
jgi:hypothetical protein